MNELKVNENVIEWLRGSKTATATLIKSRYSKRVKAYAEKYPDDVKILAENLDGSIVAHIPVKAVKITIVARKSADDTEEEIEEGVEEDLPFDFEDEEELDLLDED